MIHENQTITQTEEIQPGEPETGRNSAPRVSRMADGLIGSEILKIAADVRAMVAEGRAICNLTVGDFAPSQFPIPEFLEKGIEEELRRGETNYPPADGVAALRQGVVDFYRKWLGLEYPLESILVTGGSRPGIYATYCALVDPGDTVVYPVPSWNNNHYCHLTGAVGLPVACSSDDAFLPTAERLEGAVRDARLLALNSPLNPTGTAFTADMLADICDLVLAENRRRAAHQRPLFVMYDQVYWMLTFGATRHVDPVSLRPEMAPYTIYIDGISKAFAATGLRVGWTAGPPDVTAKMASIVGHVGAWAPRPEQIATARMLGSEEAITSYHSTMKQQVQQRLDLLYAGISEMSADGLPVESISPMGAIYLSVRFALRGMRTRGGDRLGTNEDIRRYLLRRAELAIVPFQAFGMTEESGWFRLSVGAVSADEIQQMLPRLREALEELSE
jgi:aspartate aminotransferase